MMSFNAVITFGITVLVLFFILKIVSFPFKILIKLIINSILGGLLILFINFIGGGFGISIGLNLFTTIFVGITGIPGAIILIIVQKFFM